MLPDGNPTEGHLSALQAIADQEVGHPTIVNIPDAEECCTCGWARPIARRSGYVLTDQGRRLLEDVASSRAIQMEAITSLARY